MGRPMSPQDAHALSACGLGVLVIVKLGAREVVLYVPYNSLAPNLFEAEELMDEVEEFVACALPAIGVRSQHEVQSRSPVPALEFVPHPAAYVAASSAVTLG